MSETKEAPFELKINYGEWDDEKLISFYKENKLDAVKWELKRQLQLNISSFAIDNGVATLLKKNRQCSQK